MALAISNEARGEKYDISRAAIGYVIMNRLGDKDFPKSICEIIYQKHQFSTIHKHKLKDKKLILLSEKILKKQIPNPIGNRKYFNQKRLGKRIKTKNQPLVLENHIFY